MKRIKEPNLKVIHFDNIDVIATSGTGHNMHPGWGPNKHDNGLIDGHDMPPGQRKKLW